jgi:hypothetical protein
MHDCKYWISRWRSHALWGHQWPDCLAKRALPCATWFATCYKGHKNILFNQRCQLHRQLNWAIWSGAFIRCERSGRTEAAQPHE